MNEIIEQDAEMINECLSTRFTVSDKMVESAICSSLPEYSRETYILYARAEMAKDNAKYILALEKEAIKKEYNVNGERTPNNDTLEGLASGRQAFKEAKKEYLNLDRQFRERVENTKSASKVLDLYRTQQASLRNAV